MTPNNRLLGLEESAVLSILPGSVLAGSALVPVPESSSEAQCAGSGAANERTATISAKCKTLLQLKTFPPTTNCIKTSQMRIRLRQGFEWWVYRILIEFTFSKESFVRFVPFVAN
jgi:hypothetical protein